MIKLKKLYNSLRSKLIGIYRTLLFLINTLYSIYVELQMKNKRLIEASMSKQDGQRSEQTHLSFTDTSKGDHHPNQSETM